MANKAGWLAALTIAACPGLATADQAGVSPPVTQDVTVSSLSTSGPSTYTGRGAGGQSRVSSLTGFPVPPGYRVAWTDGRLNPDRGPRRIIRAE